MTKARKQQRASSFWARKSGCDGKVQMTQTVASRTAKRGKYRLVAYFCKFCGWWHVGESLGKVEDKKRTSKLHPDNESGL